MHRQFLVMRTCLDLDRTENVREKFMFLVLHYCCSKLVATVYVVPLFLIPIPRIGDLTALHTYTPVLADVPAVLLIAIFTYYYAAACTGTCRPDDNRV